MPDALSPGVDLAKVYGESARCPICGAFAHAVPHPDHHWVCGVCGAPRVEMPEGEPLPEESLIALREANTARRGATIQRLSTWAMAVPAAFSLLLGIVLAPASFLAAGIIVGGGVLLAILASRASRRAATERKRLRAAVERAYEAAILALTMKDKTPAEIAAGLHIAEADVEAAIATQTGMPAIRVAEPIRIAKTETETETETDTGTEAETETESEAEIALKRMGKD